MRGTQRAFEEAGRLFADLPMHGAAVDTGDVIDMRHMRATHRLAIVFGYSRRGQREPARQCRQVWPETT